LAVRGAGARRSTRWIAIDDPVDRMKASYVTNAVVDADVARSREHPAVIDPSVAA
jgi:hypothetical protein